MATEKLIGCVNENGHSNKQNMFMFFLDMEGGNITTRGIVLIALLVMILLCGPLVKYFNSIMIKVTYAYKNSFITITF